MRIISMYYTGKNNKELFILIIILNRDKFNTKYS